METITVTVRTMDGTYKQTVEGIPLDMVIGDFLDEAKNKAGLSSVPCDLILDRTNDVLRDSNTFQNAGVRSGDSLTLSPATEGG